MKRAVVFLIAFFGLLVLGPRATQVIWRAAEMPFSLAERLDAQNLSDPAKTQVEIGIPAVYTIAISATAAVNNQTTLTIPQPPSGQYNYVCKLEFSASQNGTSTANPNSTTSSTNFNSWAWKYSLAATANLSYEHSFDMGNPATGCAKSTSPGTVTTFVSPAALTNTAFTWSATYYQAK
jgi:hypothetical protein